jgi:phosphonate transport system ATP-binding protein
MIFALQRVSVQHVSVQHHAASGTAAHALSDICINIGAGEQVALIGPSGAGKTTLLHTLACAHRPDSGTIRVFDADPWSLHNAGRHALRRRLFLAPQTPPLPPRQRVVTAVLAGRLPHWSIWQALRSLIKPVDPQLAYDALARFNLEHKLYARVDRLSGGERQRCGMARLLVSDADALLVDEPLSALDPTLAVQTIAVLQQEAAARGAALICSLHQVELARAHFPRIIGLREGRIVFDASRNKVTNAMIDALYRNAAPAPVATPSSETPEEAVLLHPATGGRCF